MSGAEDGTPDVSFESVSAENAIDVAFDGYTFRIAAGRFVCDCGGHLTEINFAETFERKDVVALGLGTICRDCGEDTLHIAYPPVDDAEGADA